MTPNIKPLIAGNWKMNGLSAQLEEIIAIAQGMSASSAYEALICTPATLMERAAVEAGESGLKIGGQDCHQNASGAHTGDVSAPMIADVGASFVIVGHSERRTDHGENDADVSAKSMAAYEAGLCAIICVGETREEREAGKAMEIVSTQLAGSIPDDATPQNTVIAYEPVWAIGTGLVPSNEDIEAMHAHIRAVVEKRFGGEGALMRILYGGSLKPSNAAEILSINNVDGGLIGGASLKASDFLAICGAVPA